MRTATQPGQGQRVANMLEAPTTRLIDHALFSMAADERAFRQALVLDAEKALARFEISVHAQRCLDATLQLLDRLTTTLVDCFARSARLQSLMSTGPARRVLLFAPDEAGEIFQLATEERSDLYRVAEMANVLAETLFNELASTHNRKVARRSATR